MQAQKSEHFHALCFMHGSIMEILWRYYGMEMIDDRFQYLIGDARTAIALIFAIKA